MPAGLPAAAGLLLLAAVLFAWFHAMPPEQRANRRAAAAGRALEMALDDYAAAHQGRYPGAAAITGGPGDILVRSGIIRFFPDNPFHPGRVMKNTPPGAFAPGDFSYTRDEDKAYRYTLVVYARTRNAGPRRDGVIFRHRQNP